MTEYLFELEDLNPLEFFGVNNHRLNQLKDAYPEISFIARGNELMVKGKESEIEPLVVTIESILEEIRKNDTISEENFGEILIHRGESPRIELPEGNLILHGARGNAIKARTGGQKKILAAAARNDIVFAVGPAGTGKTYLAVALAVKALKEKHIRKIFLVRPAVEAGENLGFLPGDLKEKVDPYLRPLYDALEDMIHFEKLQHYLERNIIEVAPLAYMRGRTLSNAFVILDEAQNATETQLKMFLTRMGKDSKIIVTGDVSQIDLPHYQKSGLLQAINILQDIEGISFVRLKGSDVVRHKLVRDIIAAYDKVTPNDMKPVKIPRKFNKD